jgi:hypothetical protein
VAGYEAGHFLVGLKIGRKVVDVWVQGKEGCVEIEPFRWRRGPHPPGFSSLKSAQE